MSIAQEGDDFQIHLWNNNSGCILCHRSKYTPLSGIMSQSGNPSPCWMIMSCFTVLVSAALCLIMTLKTMQSISIYFSMRVSQCIHFYNVFNYDLSKFFDLQPRPDTFEPLSTKFTASLTGLRSIFSTSLYWFLMKFDMHQWRNDAVCIQHTSGRDISSSLTPS